MIVRMARELLQTFFHLHRRNKIKKIWLIKYFFYHFFTIVNKNIHIFRRHSQNDNSYYFAQYIDRAEEHAVDI